MLEIFLVSIITGIFTGLIVAAWLRIFIRHHIEQLNESEFEQGNIIRAYIEEAEDQLFIYEIGTNNFLAQGKDWESLNVALLSRYPGKMFDVPTSQIEKAREFKSELTE